MNKLFKDVIQKVYDPLNRRHDELRNKLLNNLSATPPIKQSKRKNHIMKTLKIAGKTGIAASIVIAISIFLLSRSASLSAAEMLAEAQNASSNYKGWVYIQGGNPPSPGHFTLIDTVTNTYVRANDQHGEPKIVYLNPVTNEYLQFDKTSNTILYNFSDYDNAKSRVKNTIKLISSESLLGLMDKTVTLEISISQKGMTDEITVVNTGPRKGVEPTGKEPKQLTILADSQSRLIQKIDVLTHDNFYRTFSFSYNNTHGDFDSIYDFDVPRDAKLVDAKATATDTPETK